MTTLEDQLTVLLANEIQKEIDQKIMIELLSNWPDSLYAGKKIGPCVPEGWAGEWSTFLTYNDSGWELWASMVSWIRVSIHNPEKNACWVWNNGRIQVYIRKPQDLTAFLLKWS